MDLLACEPTQIKETLEEQGVRSCFSGYVDLHGRLKGKIVPLSHFDQMVKGSELYTGAALDGVPQEINDEEVSSHPDVAHGFILPWNKEVAFFPSNLYNQGKPFEACSRNILSRQVERAAKMGYKMNLGVETEFFMLRDERESLARGERTQGAPTGVAGINTIRDRDTLDKPCYDVATAHDNFHWLIELVDAMDELGWDVYSFDHEDARSQFEIDFMYSDVLSMADRVAFFRYMAGDIARKHGYFASFMPKPFANMSGSGARAYLPPATRFGRGMRRVRGRPARTRGVRRRHVRQLPFLQAPRMGGVHERSDGLGMRPLPHILLGKSQTDRTHAPMTKPRTYESIELGNLTLENGRTLYAAHVGCALWGAPAKAAGFPHGPSPLLPTTSVPRSARSLAGESTGSTSSSAGRWAACRPSPGTRFSPTPSAGRSRCAPRPSRAL